MRVTRLTGLAVAAALGVALARLLPASRWSLHGRVAIVTGGSRGLGLELAQEIARRGGRLVICGREDSTLEAAVARLRENSAAVVGLRCDVGDPTQAQRLVEQTRQTYGRIDLVVNNAGIIDVGPQETMHTEDYHAALDTMFWGPLHVTQAAVPELRATKGRILNVTSIGGRTSVSRLLPYCSAKFAALAFSEGMTAAMMRQGVSVTTAVPGMMRTGSHWHARFRGAPRGEYSWFALAASLPVLSINAHRAARRMIDAVCAGRSHLTLTPMAHMASLAHGIAPGLTTRALGVVDALLPRAKTSTVRSGAAAEAELRTPIIPWLTQANAAAGRELHQQSSTDGAAPDTAQEATADTAAAVAAAEPEPDFADEHTLSESKPSAQEPRGKGSEAPHRPTRLDGGPARPV